MKEIYLEFFEGTATVINNIFKFSKMQYKFRSKTYYFENILSIMQSNCYLFFIIFIFKYMYKYIIFFKIINKNNSFCNIVF